MRIEQWIRYFLWVNQEEIGKSWFNLKGQASSCVDKWNRLQFSNFHSNPIVCCIWSRKNSRKSFDRSSFPFQTINDSSIELVENLKFLLPKFRSLRMEETKLWWELQVKNFSLYKIGYQKFIRRGHCFHFIFIFSDQLSVNLRVFTWNNFQLISRYIRARPKGAKGNVRPRPILKLHFK